MDTIACMRKNRIFHTNHTAIKCPLISNHFKKIIQLHLVHYTFYLSLPPFNIQSTTYECQNVLQKHKANLKLRTHVVYCTMRTQGNNTIMEKSVNINKLHEPMFIIIVRLLYQNE